MIFLAITKTQKKIHLLLKLTLLILLLSFLVPSLYDMMIAANALEKFQEPSEEYPGEPMRVEADPWSEATGYWRDIEMMIYEKK
ncbi:MAG: hypothetical protein RR396_03455 [Clostridiales bacterium]